MSHVFRQNLLDDLVLSCCYYEKDYITFDHKKKSFLVSLLRSVCGQKFAYFHTKFREKIVEGGEHNQSAAFEYLVMAFKSANRLFIEYLKKIFFSMILVIDKFKLFTENSQNEDHQKNGFGGYNLTFLIDYENILQYIANNSNYYDENTKELINAKINLFKKAWYRLCMSVLFPF